MQLPMNPQRQQQAMPGAAGPARPTAVLRAAPGNSSSVPAPTATTTPAGAHSSRAVQQQHQAWYSQQGQPHLNAQQGLPRQAWQPQLTSVPSNDVQTPMSTITEPPQMADQAAGPGAEQFTKGWGGGAGGLSSSLASTTTLAGFGGGAAEEKTDDPKFSRLESRVDQAAGLASQVAEALQQFTQRVDDVLNELRTEMPRIRQETANRVAELEKGALTAHTQRIEALEQGLRVEKEARSADGHMQAQSLDAVSQSLSEEIEARTELEKQLPKQFHEQLSSEVDSVRDMMMREMRERMDGQKVLREEMQIQQQALMRSTHCLDEALIELRTEVPRLGQELVSQKALCDRMVDAHSTTSARLEDVEAKSLQQTSELRESTRAAIREQQERIDAKGKTLGAEIADLRGRLDEHRARADATNADVRAAREAAEALAREAADRRRAFDGLSSQLRSSQDQNDKQTNDFESKVTAIETDLRLTTQSGLTDLDQTLRTWIETQAIRRIGLLEQALRKEMTDRTATTQQVLDKISKNAERWCNMQDKFDEILVAMHKAPAEQIPRGNAYPM